MRNAPVNLLILLLAGVAAGAPPPPTRQRFSLAAAAPPAVEFRDTAGILPGATALAVARDGGVWVGTLKGLWRWSPRGEAGGGRWQYWAGRRYLPDDRVLALAAAGDAVWARTPKGDVRLSLESMTLEEKAQRYEDLVERRHNRWGMVADSELTRPGELASNRLVSSDNDGLWTAMYGAAECFRYAVTHDRVARERAERSVEALLYLESITGIPGFPARSYIKPGEPQPGDGVWYDNAELGLRWKADTSSDEIVGHFFLFSVAFDTLPDAKLKQRIAATTRRIMDHILSHGYYLIDRTGKPTTWGRWSPEYFASKPGRPDSPLNAVELLSFLRAARHITGDGKYDAEYKKVARTMGYAQIATQYRELSDELNYSDEELAMLSFYTLLRYEREGDLVALYRKGLEGWWHNIRRERNPLWNLIYLHSNPGVPREPWTGQGLETLERLPLDLVHWTVDNSARRDMEWDRSEDRFRSRQSLNWLPPDERPVMKWNGNPFMVNGGNGGRSEDDGAIFLLPYWLGRYWKAW